jgi:hypothetical protein
VGQILCSVAGCLAFGGLAAATFVARPRTRAEEMRRRQDNDRERVTYKMRVGDTWLSAWFFSLFFGGIAAVFAGLFLYSCARAVWSVLR